MITILMIEDDEEFAQLLINYLKRYNISVTNFTDPLLGLSAGIHQYDLLILDLTLPYMDGLEVCKRVVSQHDIPIIISSARSDLSDKVLGLQMGADDYLPKPYDPQEMYARIVSVLRRCHKLKESSTKRFVVDESKTTIAYHDEILHLTPAEYTVLALLIKNEGSTVSKEQIIYGSDIFQNSNESSLSVIISRLRKKLENRAEIKNIRGLGYRLA